METSPSRSRVIFIVIFLIIFSAFITFILITLTNKNKNNLPKENAAHDLCAPFAANQGEISCEDAVKKASADTKGKITKITFGIPALPDAIKKAFGDPKEMWLIDIVLEKPTITSQGKEIKSLQIGIPTDETRGIFRIPIQP